MAAAAPALVSLTVVDSKTLTIAADAKDVKCVAAIADLKTKNPNVLFAIARSKNLNIVVYEAQVDSKDATRLKPELAVDVYWLDIDPAYVKANRDKGVKHDRSELIWLEKSMAYGCTATLSTTVQTPVTYNLALVSVPGRDITVAIDQAAKRPRAYITLTNPETKKPVKCVMERIFVSSTDRWVGPPKVDFVEICGVSLADGSVVTEKIIPS